MAPKIFDQVISEMAGGDPRKKKGLQQGGSEGQMMGACIRHPALDNPIYAPFRATGELDGQKLCALIEKAQQSHQDLAIDDELQVTVTRVMPPSGTGRDRDRMNWQERYERHSGHGNSSIIKISNKDNLCCARAIVVGRARQLRTNGEVEMKKYRTILRGRGNGRQTVEARQLMEQAGLGGHTGGCGLEELKKIQDVLPEYNLTVFWKEGAHKLYFKGPNEQKPPIYLLLHDNHYDLLTSAATFLGRTYYCDACNKCYERLDEHRCNAKCIMCKRVGLCKKTEKIYCADCNLTFFNQDCFEAHKKTTSVTVKDGETKRKIPTSVCMRFKRCKNCGALTTTKNLRGRKHRCGEQYCSICRKLKPKGHICYMQKYVKKGENKENESSEEEEEEEEGDNEFEGGGRPTRFLFFDLETTQNTPIGENALGPINLHVVNLCVVQKACDICKDWPDIKEECTVCGERQKIFKGENSMEEFCKWLFRKEHKRCVVLAHNMKGFDGQFLLKYLHDNAILPRIILRGLQIMRLEAEGIVIKDSLNYLPMALAALPKAFNIKELKKGYYPYLFNTKENENYVGPYPDASFYCPDQMKTEEREKFLKWHSEKRESGETFDNEKELREYCISDVNILRVACMRFRDLFIKVSNVDPLSQGNTIASTCNIVYRQNFLQENTIAIIPEGGYRRHEKQSAVALKWMLWREKKEGLRIQHKCTGGEKQIGRYRVDGYVERPGQKPLILEFNGCAYHGCESCFKDRTKRLPHQKTALEAHQQTMEREKYLREFGDLESLWECELNRQLRTNKEMAAFFKEVEVPEPMDPRKALYGGRTNAICLYHKCGPQERIDYIDICSLYPYVCKYGSYPVGKPRILTRDFEKMTKNDRPYHGIVRCIVKPPRNLFLPILPFRANNKLNFPLCALCCVSQSNESCKHTDKERQLKGEWATIELYKALELGYEIVEILEACLQFFTQT